MKGLIFYLIQITQREKEALIRERPDFHVHRTVKQKSKRHHYYIEENPRVLRALRAIRRSGRI